MRNTLFIALLSILSLGACSAPATTPAECEAIVDRCHPLDLGTGTIHDCHEYAEAAGRTAAECTARQSECFAACTAASDAGTDAATE
jgi:hypothetical protein